MTDRNGATISIGARVRFTTDHQRERWVEGWVRDVAEHTFYHPKTTRWEARVDNGAEARDDFLNGATILAWVPCSEIEVSEGLAPSSERDLLEKIATAMDAERAAVVAWLLERGHYTADAYAGTIERGEHRREEKP